MYSQEEQRLIDAGKATMASTATESSKEKEKVLESGDPLVSIKTNHLGDDKLVTGIAESVVDGEMEELAAFELSRTSRELAVSLRSDGVLKNIVKEVNGHSFYQLQERDLRVPGFKHREWRSVVVWKKEDEGNLIVCCADTDALDEEHPRDPTVVAGTARTTWVYERLPEVEGIPQVSPQGGMWSALSLQINSNS